ETPQETEAKTSLEIDLQTDTPAAPPVLSPIDPPTNDATVLRLHHAVTPLPSQEVSFRGLDNSDKPPTKYGGAPPDMEKPNFAPTGLLAKEANTVAGTKISLKYHEPPEARKPPSSQQWRLFIFKGPDMLDSVELHTRSCTLLGRAQEVADIVLGHPSSSQQHAAIQFRYITKNVEDEYGVRQKKGKVKPYVIDLESSNGTELNGERLDTGRYVELRDKDILKFGASEREYVVMLPPPER
ncbi:SMAD/FHA domain-containing protein, partial [Zopfia rhizophila CBS 207.26]